MIGRTTVIDTGKIIIRIFKYPVTTDDYSIVVHEIFHSVQFTFDNIGIKLNNETSEAWAYLIDYITRQIFNKI